MNLQAYLDDRDISDFAKEVGVHISTVYRWMSGDTMPSPHYMTKIRTATDGKVTPNDFYS